MKFIYKLDCVMSPMCSLSDNNDMDYEDTDPSMGLELVDSKSHPLVERNNLMEGLMMQLSTCPTYPNEAGPINFANLKPVDTDDVASANGHYTLEDFFNNYAQVSRNESISDIREADLDFSKFFVSFEDASTDNPFQSLIELVKCEIPADLSAVDSRFPKDIKPSSPARSPSPDPAPPTEVVVKTEVVHAPPKPKARAKKARKPPATRHESGGTKHLEKECVNNRKIDYGANDTIENIYDLEWHPGFTRHLGAKGRSALLELVRRVYRQDPEHYKAILQSRNSPSSISSLPFYSIPMLWELAHQFGIFKQALTVYKNHCFSKSKANRNYGFGRTSQTSASSDSSENQDVETPVKRESETPLVHDLMKGPMTTMSGRLVKRSKKILEYTPESITDSIPYATTVEVPAPQPQEKSLELPLKEDAKDELSTLASSPEPETVEMEANPPTSEMKLVWKMAVAKGAANCLEELKKTPSAPRITRRISV